MPWLRPLEALRVGFNLRRVHVKLAVEIVARRYISIRVRRFFRVYIIPPLLYTHPYPHVALTGRTNGRNLGTFQKAFLFQESLNRKLLPLFQCLQYWLATFNPLKPELNPICYLLALLGAHHFLHVSRIRVKLLTFRRLMSYIYGAPILDVSRSHTTTQHSR